MYSPDICSNIATNDKMMVGLHLNEYSFLDWFKRNINGSVWNYTKKVVSEKIPIPLSLSILLHPLGVDAIQYGWNDYTSSLSLWMLKRLQGKFSVSIHGPYESPEYSLSSSNEKIRCSSVKKLERIARIAEKMGSFVVIHPGGQHYNDYNRTRESFYKSLEELCSKGLGKIISVETKPNIRDYVLTTTPEGLDEIEVMLELYPVNITYDVRGFVYGHKNEKEANEYAREGIRRFDQKINCVHLSDFQPGNNNHLGIDEGIIEWESFAKELNSIGYNRDLIIEVMETPHIISSILKLRSLLKNNGYS